MALSGHEYAVTIRFRVRKGAAGWLVERIVGDDDARAVGRYFPEKQDAITYAKTRLTALENGE